MCVKMALASSKVLQRSAAISSVENTHFISSYDGRNEYDWQSSKYLCSTMILWDALSAIEKKNKEGHEHIFDIP